MVTLRYSVSSTLPCNYHLSHKGFFFFLFQERLSFPGSFNKSILLFGFPPTEKRKRTYLQYLQHMSFITESWYSCFEQAAHAFVLPEQTAAQSANYSINFSTRDWKTYDGIAVVIKAALTATRWQTISKTFHSFVQDVQFLASSSPKVRWRFSENK